MVEKSLLWGWYESSVRTCLILTLTGWEKQLPLSTILFIYSQKKEKNLHTYQRIPRIIIILTQDFSHRKKEDLLMRRSAYTDFDETIRKLNETMGLCIK